jgi:2-polyprenyl-6-methoxyphenol hydroxylase-like FAD-dependent oxidoreductase
MHGIMLKHHGYTVTILEQDVSPSREGYDAGVKEGPDGRAFLERHDRVKRPYTLACMPPRTINHDGKVRSQSGQAITTTSWGLLIRILRANFDGTTSKAVPQVDVEREGDGEVEYKNGARVTDVKDSGAKVHVQYEEVSSGTVSLEADIVIVADGANSSMRKLLMPDVKRQYAGYMCWRGTVREDLVDDRWNKQYSERATFHFMKRSYLLLYARRENILSSPSSCCTGTLFPQTQATWSRESACTTGSGIIIYRRTLRTTQMS